MKTFEEYILDEGLKDWISAFNRTMQDFHMAKDIDTDISNLIKRTEWLINTRQFGKPLGGSDMRELKSFLVVLKNAKLDTKQGRLEVGKAEKRIAPLLKSFNIGIKI